MGVRGKPVSAAEIASMLYWWKQIGTYRGVARRTGLCRRTVHIYLRDGLIRNGWRVPEMIAEENPKNSEKGLEE